MVEDRDEDERRFASVLFAVAIYLLIVVVAVTACTIQVTTRAFDKGFQKEMVPGYDKPVWRKVPCQ